MDIIILSRNIIKSRKKWLLIHFFVSLFLLLLIEVAQIDAYNELFIIYALWQVMVYGWLLFSELRYPGLNVLSVLFVGTLLGFAIPSFTASIDLINGEKIYYGEVNEITDFVFHTSTAINIYFCSFILLITFFTKGKFFIIDINQVAKRFNLFYLAIGLYFIALVLRLIPFLELFSSTLANLAGNLPMLVLFILAVYCGYNSRHDKYYYLFLLLLIVEIIYAMLFGYYKGTVARAAAMYIVYYYLYSRTLNKPVINGRMIMIGMLFLVFLLYIVYPFITLRRSESGFTAMTNINDLREVNNFDIFRRVITLDYEIMNDDTESALSERMSSLSHNAFFYRDAYYKGYHKDMIVHSMRVMIPRFLSPKKPEGSAGIMATNYVCCGVLDPIGDAATSIGPFGGAYFWGGWPAVILMCVVNSLVFSLILIVCFSNMHNLFSWIFIFLLLFTMLMCFKESTDGGYSRDIYFLIYTAIIYLTTKLFYRKRPMAKKKKKIPIQ